MPISSPFGFTKYWLQRRGHGSAPLREHEDDGRDRCEGEGDARVDLLHEPNRAGFGAAYGGPDSPLQQADAAGPHFGTWMLSVNKNSKNKEWAYQAISWLTAAEQQTAMTEKSLHPSRSSVYSAIKDDHPLAAFYETLGKSLEVGVGRARLTNYTEVSHEIAVAVNNAARGSASPEQALKGAADKISTLLKSAGYC